MSNKSWKKQDINVVLIRLLVMIIPILLLVIGSIKETNELAEKEMEKINQKEQECIDFIKEKGQDYIDLYNDSIKNEQITVSVDTEPIFEKQEDKVCYLFNNKYDLEISSESVHINLVSKADNKTVIQSVINIDESTEIQVHFYQDDNYITDDYSKVIFGDLINDTINQVLNDNNIDNPDYYMFYSMNKAKIINLDEYNDYLINTDTHIVLNINVDNIENYEEMIVKLCNDFDTNNLKYIINVTLKEDTIKLYRDKQHLDIITVDDIKFNKEND